MEIKDKHRFHGASITLRARTFGVYTNAPGVRGKLIGREILDSRSASPGILSSQTE